MLEDWQKRDKSVNWHPYTQEKLAKPLLVISKGKGAKLWDVEGKEYIDAISSWWCNPHGHCHPYIVEKIHDQLKELEHVLFGGVTHPRAIELSEKLLSVLPNNQSRVFYSDNGSTAVEVALKMSLQYFFNKGIKKDSIIAFENAFHGDTLGAMASSGISLFTNAFSDFLLPVNRIPLPNDENIKQVCKKLKEIIKQNKPAAFIFEPLVQGAAGMRIYKPEHLDLLIKICKAHGVLCIADEVMTGFGKTGKLFACNYLQEKPDIMCFSKALTSGFLPMSITTCTKEIYSAFYSDDTSKSFFHGHTFTAYPTGCAAALASLELTLAKETKDNIERINACHQTFSKELKKINNIENIAVLGVILRFEIKTKKEDEVYGELRNKLYEFYINNGLILRPLGNVVYILPPFCIKKEDLEKIYQKILESIKVLT